MVDLTENEEKEQLRKEKAMMTILILMIFVFLFIGAILYCCQKCIQASQKGTSIAPVNKIPSAKKEKKKSRPSGRNIQRW